VDCVQQCIRSDLYIQTLELLFGVITPILSPANQIIEAETAFTVVFTPLQAPFKSSRTVGYRDGHTIPGNGRDYNVQYVKYFNFYNVKRYLTISLLLLAAASSPSKCSNCFSCLTCSCYLRFVVFPVLAFTEHLHSLMV
jgi:hypothetical protein